MMWLFLGIVLAALLVQVWLRLTPAQQAQAEQFATRIGRAVRAGQVDLSQRLFRRRYAYHRLFLGEHGRPSDVGQIVLADLTRFCRGLTSITFTATSDGHTDLFRTGVAEGRREVLLHILKEIGLDLPSLVENARREDDALAA